MIVVDTNVIAYLYLDYARTRLAERVLTIDSDWIAPLLWRSEFRSVLAAYMRRGVLSLDQALDMAQRSQDRMRGREYHVSHERVLRLVDNSQCSAYDCEFVALAQQARVKLVTADKKVLSQFAGTAISLETFTR